jgi:phosphopantothenoylcysteine decarboxylase / phosphopantothenate---cysteine ligase
VVTDALALDADQQIAHIELAEAADAIVVAPATANAIAELAAGLVDDAVSAIVCAGRAPVIVAPAMDAGMWTHPATQRNIETLRAFGYRIVEPEVGVLASGLTGIGRLAEPPTIVEAVEHLFARSGDLDGVRVVVSAGGTREPIDPVRFIGNRSSGKMGVAVAEAARDRGAGVTLNSSSRPRPYPGGCGGDEAGSAGPVPSEPGPATSARL